MMKDIPVNLPQIQIGKEMPGVVSNHAFEFNLGFLILTLTKVSDTEIIVDVGRVFIGGRVFPKGLLCPFASAHSKIGFSKGVMRPVKFGLDLQGPLPHRKRLI